MDQDLLERSVTEATTEVFSTMLGIDIRCMGAASPPRRSEFGIISLVGITGEWAGSGVVCCSPALASVLCSRMLGGEEEPSATAINEEVLDVVAEITNMMIGNIKNGLECVQCADRDPRKELRVSELIRLKGRGPRFFCGR